MWVRRAFYRWLFPAAFVLPLWILIGWIVFDAGGWALVWVLFLAIPSVFLGQIVLALLVRARGTVRAHRAVSWWDVLGFTVWHALIIATGWFSAAWFAPTLVAAVLVAVGLFWLTLWQLWHETTGSLRAVLSAADRPARLPKESAKATSESPHDVIVIAERPRPE